MVTNSSYLENSWTQNGTTYTSKRLSYDGFLFQFFEFRNYINETIIITNGFWNSNKQSRIISITINPTNEFLISPFSNSQFPFFRGDKLSIIFYSNLYIIAIKISKA